MTLKTTQLRDAIKFAIAVGSTTLAGTGVALAQETQEATTLDRVEVTGSRIKRADIETSQPIFSLNRDEIQAQGLTSVGDVIQNISANGSALNSNVNNGGNGETQVDLRNLGSQRTLVLVNGRRWVGGTGLGGAVDLNTIPTAAVERIEVLKDGASVIYGSDAIAGVVNVILRQNFDGAEANAYIGQFDKGDGVRQAYDFTVGSTGDRWSAMVGVGYVQEEPVMAGDRYISKEPTYRTGLGLASSTTPAGRFAVCPDDAVFDPVFGTCTIDGDDAQRRPLTPSTGGGTGPGTPINEGGAGQPNFTYNPGNTGNAWRNRTGADLYNFAPDNYLLTPQERISLFANGSLDITDNVRFKVNATYNERKSEQLLAAMPIVLGTGPGASPNARPIIVSEDNIYNPFGERITRIQRRATETGGRLFQQDVDTWAFNGAFEGDFDVGDRFYSWEAGYFYGKNENTQVTDGLFSLLALRDGLGPSFIDPADGVAKCGTPGAVLVGCVPLNLLGLNSLTPEMLDYASFTAIDQLTYEQKTYFANISGDIVSLPGGMLSFAAGYEHRDESGSDNPDPLTANGNSTGNNRRPTNGSYKVEELFVELAVPLLADLPGAKLLDVSLASRYSDYDTFGDTINNKFGFRWKPVDDLLVRGNWSEGFRAPSIAELFTGVSDSFPTIGDPCSTTFGGAYNQLSPEQQARCHAQGVPVGGYDQGNAQIRTNIGGNVNLQPETSTTSTFGLVYSPSYVEGLDISLDWWKIELDDAISVFTGQQVLDFCIEDGIDAFCNYTRTSTGAISNLTTLTQNIGGTEVEGYDLTVSYRLPEYSWGKLSFIWDTTYTTKYEQDLDGDGVLGEEVDDGGGNQVGEYQGGTTGTNRWRIRSNLGVRWELSDFSAAWNMRYYSRQEETCPFYYNDYGFGELCSDATVDADGLIEAGSTNKIGAVTYHDISGSWNAPWNARITLGINNVFDKDPPSAYTAFANTFDSQYEIPGQFFYMRYTQKF